ncbi:hypothetical protein NDU88_001827 [Pleurodeles waltl]|uniref:Uncharacterized protein n=1 Tax=Pleurodeles waltl TaxID=8319 RepID=A0AAV7NLB8_PLEWA|nr:hypothetical protein NDU88_001827 [Pleurodeles waltl]
MTERLDKHADCLDGAERRISEFEDVQAGGETAHMLQAHAEDLKVQSRRNNLRIVGVIESTRIDNMERFVEQLLQDLLGRDSFLFMAEQVHRLLAPQQLPGAPPKPILLLNFRDMDAALQRAQELKELKYAGTTMSLYPDFTEQVQDARKLFLPAKCKLKDFNMDYSMLYPACLWVLGDIKVTIFRDPKAVMQLVKHSESAGRHSNSPRSNHIEPDGDMDEVE